MQLFISFSRWGFIAKQQTVCKITKDEASWGNPKEIKGKTQSEKTNSENTKAHKPDLPQ